MFQNSYQNGSYFDFFDPKASPDKLKPLMKTVNLPASCKVFDKDIKTYVMEALTPNGRIQFPRQDKKDLYLIQQFLVFQIYFFQGLSWSIELTVSDLTKTKRRIILSPATTKLQIKPFFVKEPCRGWQEGLWNNFAVDLYSFMEAFKGQTYRSLDCIHISGHFKLRRIYTAASEPFEGESQELKSLNFLPKQFNFPLGLPNATFTNRFEADAFSQAPSQIAENSTKNSSFLKSSKAKSTIPQVSQQKKERMSHEKPKKITKVEDVKTEHCLQREKKESSHTAKRQSGQGMRQSGQGMRQSGQGMRQSEHAAKSESEPAVKRQRSEQIAKRQSDYLIKKENTQIKRESVDKKAQIKKKRDFLSNTNGELIARKKQKPTLEKNAESQKLIFSSKPPSKPTRKPKEINNPWRNNNNELSEGSNLAVSKHQGNRKAVTPNQDCYGFKKAKEGAFNQTKNRFQSDSDYVQLSQKFSTLTDGKFFKREISQNVIPKAQEADQDEIEENIEMETNSFYSSHKKEEDAKRSPQKEEFIKESIGDSLDDLGDKEKGVEDMGRSSLYGFGENLMRNFMHDIERPYSPPMGERESQQQQSPNCREQKDEVELIYDPVLNCYYDYKTHTYYQLKN